MKKILVSIVVLTLFFYSCKTISFESYNDDIYKSPREEKQLAKIAEAEKLKKEAEEKQRREVEALAKKAKDDANPYYKDPQYNSDDYYDYQYASKIRRFQNPLMGAGYYNNYYTNSYMYNQNPSMYGHSIYNSYNWWMPFNQFNYYANSSTLGLYGGNNFNNYYNYYPYSNSMYYGYPSYLGLNNYNTFNNNSFGYGYANGFVNGNWGYFNSYDVNSLYSKAEFGPRGSNGGGNSIRSTFAGMLVPDESQARYQFIKELADKQATTTQFFDVPRKNINHVSTQHSGNGEVNSIEIKNSSGRNLSGNNSNTTNQTPVKTDNIFWPKLTNENQNLNSSFNQNSNGENGNPVRGNSSPGKLRSVNAEDGFDNSTNTNRIINSGSFNNGSQDAGSSSPRNNTGGSSNRPR